MSSIVCCKKLSDNNIINSHSARHSEKQTSSSCSSKKHDHRNNTTKGNSSNNQALLSLAFIARANSLNKCIKIKKKNNLCRTNLLILVNKELSENLKKLHTKINDRTLLDAERDFSAQNNLFVNLEEENFSPRCSSNKGEGSQMKFGGIIHSSTSLTSIKSSPKSRQSISPPKESDNSEVSSCLQFDIDSVNHTPPENINFKIKTSLSYKKIAYFKMKTLRTLSEEDMSKGNSNNNTNSNDITNSNDNNNSNNSNNNASTNNLLNSVASPRPLSKKTKKTNLATVNENIEYINVDCGFKNNINTRKRTENGFKYLRTLAIKLKRTKSKKALKNQIVSQENYETFKEILYLKENIDIDNDQELADKEKLHYIRDGHRLPSIVVIESIEADHERNLENQLRKIDRRHSDKSDFSNNNYGHNSSFDKSSSKHLSLPLDPSKSSSQGSKNKNKEIIHLISNYNSNNNYTKSNTFNDCNNNINKMKRNSMIYTNSYFLTNENDKDLPEKTFPTKKKYSFNSKQYSSTMSKSFHHGDDFSIKLHQCSSSSNTHKHSQQNSKQDKVDAKCCNFVLHSEN